MSKFKNWKDVKKELDFTPEEIEEMELEKEIIKATIEARKKANLTQQELSEKSGIIQPSIAKIENFVRTPQYTTLMKMLYAMGYTLSVVPLDEKIKKENNDVLSINSGVAFGENVPTIISFKTKMTLADINLLAESIRRIKGIIRIVVSEEEGSR